MSVPALQAIFTELSKIYDKVCLQSSLLSISGADALFGDDGDVALISITYHNLDTPPKVAIEAIIGVQFIDLATWMADLILNAPLPLPPALPPGEDCAILKCCSRVDEINDLLASINNVADTPDKLSQRLAALILQIKTILRECLDQGSTTFKAPKIWDSEGKLVVDPDDAKFVFTDADTDPKVNAIEDEINEFYQDILSSINKALVKPPVT